MKGCVFMGHLPPLLAIGNVVLGRGTVVTAEVLCVYSNGGGKLHRVEIQFTCSDLPSDRFEHSPFIPLCFLFLFFFCFYVYADNLSTKQH